MTAKYLILLMLLSMAAAACLGGCSMAGSALNTTGNAFNKMGNTVRSL